MCWRPPLGLRPHGARQHTHQMARFCSAQWPTFTPPLTAPPASQSARPSSAKLPITGSLNQLLSLSASGVFQHNMPNSCLSSRDARRPSGRRIGALIAETENRKRSLDISRRIAPWSDLSALREQQSVFYIDTQISDGIFDLGVAQQDLHSPQVPGRLVDHRRLRSSQ